MQTPPDSDQETWIYEIIDDDEDDVVTDENTDPEAAGVARSGRHSLLRSSANKSSTTATANHGRALVHKQRRAQQRIPPNNHHHHHQHQDVSILSTYKPTTASTRLRTEVITMLHRTQRNGTWFDLLPARIGHNESVDCAAKAIVKAAELAERKTPITQDSCLGSYARAITSLQAGMANSVSGDDMLLTVSLLVTFERIFAYTSVPLKSHMAGVVALLMAQMKMPASKIPSELTRAVVYTFWPVAFIGPCVEGNASPFEAPRWLQAEPVVMTRDQLRTPAQVVARLRKLSMELFIRLPRLIKMVKAILKDPRPEEVGSAIKLAGELLRIEDVEAESGLLHCVTIQKTTSPSIGEITPFAMHFTTIAEFEAGGHYWSTHILLYRICWRLLALFPGMYKAQENLWTKSRLEAQISRMASNVLMASNWGVHKGEAGESCLVMCLVAVWGVLNDFDVFAARNLSPVKARMLLKACGEIIMQPKGPDKWAEVGARLETASDMFCGGKVEGVLAFTFDSKKGEVGG